APEINQDGSGDRCRSGRKVAGPGPPRTGPPPEAPPNPGGTPPDPRPGSTRPPPPPPPPPAPPRHPPHQHDPGRAPGGRYGIPARSHRERAEKAARVNRRAVPADPH